MSKNGQNGKHPNILVIWGDDIGIANLSCYTHGLMGYHTPHIDRIAREGMLFTDLRLPKVFNLRTDPFEIDDAMAKLNDIAAGSS